MAAMAAILDFRYEFSYFQSTSRSNASYQVSSQLAFWFGRRKEKSRLSRWRPWRLSLRPSCSDRNHFNYFWSTSHPEVPSKFQVIWPLGSGEEAKNRFSSRRPWRPSWVSDRNKICFLWFISHLYASFQGLTQLAFRFRGEAKNGFSRWW